MRCENYLAVLFEQRQCKQQTRDKLRGYTAVNIELAPCQLAVHRKRHGVVIFKAYAMLWKLIKIWGYRSLRKSASALESGFHAQCTSHRYKKSQGRTAFATVKLRCFGNIFYACYLSPVPCEIYLRTKLTHTAHCGKYVLRGIDIRYGRSALRQCCGNYHSVCNAL